MPANRVQPRVDTPGAGEPLVVFTPKSAINIDPRNQGGELTV
uniref:Uncharacterized protein n=1 Tax=Anguilla anguilla TaxID=7936 RepID=A0A0E9QMP7_ANGAN